MNNDKVRGLLVGVAVVSIVGGFYGSKMKNKDGEYIFGGTPAASISAKASKTTSSVPKVRSWTLPMNFGNGVYYFRATKGDFANALSYFLMTHDCKVEGMAADDKTNFGLTEGYFVVCR